MASSMRGHACNSSQDALTHSGHYYIAWVRSNDLEDYGSYGAILLYPPVIDNQLIVLYPLRVPLFGAMALPYFPPFLCQPQDKASRYHFNVFGMARIRTL